MKQIVCEMCGGNDLIKQDGVFVCQSCGTKYSLEDAKKLMVEVSGSVKVDKSDEVKNLYSSARQAVSRGEHSLGQSLYEQIYRYDSDSWEPVFFHMYCQVMQTNILGIRNAADSLSSVIQPSFAKIIELNGNEKKEAMKMVGNYVYIAATALEGGARSTFKQYYDKALRSGYGDFNGEVNDYIDRQVAVSKLLTTSAAFLDTFCDNDQELIRLAVKNMKQAVQYAVDVSLISDNWRSVQNNIYNSSTEIIRKHEPSYKLPSANVNGFPDYLIAFFRKSGRISRW